MLWTSDVVKDPWFPLVKDPSGSMSSYHLSRFTRRCNDLVKDPSEVCPSVLLPPKSIWHANSFSGP